VKRERHEGTVVPVGAVGREHVKVGLPVEQGSERLDRRDRTRNDPTLFDGGGEEVSQDLVSGSTQTREELSVVKEVGP
jgi:hypothetical protein